MISAACIKSGHLLPLTADGAEADFFHSFLTGIAIATLRSANFHAKATESDSKPISRKCGRLPSNASIQSDPAISIRRCPSFSVPVTPDRVLAFPVTNRAARTLPLILCEFRVIDMQVSTCAFSVNLAVTSVDPDYGLPVVASALPNCRPFWAGRKSHSVGARWMFKRPVSQREGSALKTEMMGWGVGSVVPQD